MPAMLPSTDLKASAPRTIAFSVLNGAQIILPISSRSAGSITAGILFMGLMSGNSGASVTLQASSCVSRRTLVKLR